VIIAGEFGVRYHPGHVSKLLKELDWSLQKPERRASQRDDAAMRPCPMKVLSLDATCAKDDRSTRPLRSAYDLGLQVELVCEPAREVGSPRIHRPWRSRVGHSCPRRGGITIPQSGRVAGEI